MRTKYDYVYYAWLWVCVCNENMCGWIWAEKYIELLFAEKKNICLTKFLFKWKTPTPYLVRLILVHCFCFSSERCCYTHALHYILLTVARSATVKKTTHKITKTNEYHKKKFIKKISRVCRVWHDILPRALSLTCVFMCEW